MDVGEQEKEKSIDKYKIRLNWSLQVMTDRQTESNKTEEASCLWFAERTESIEPR